MGPSVRAPIQLLLLMLLLTASPLLAPVSAKNRSEVIRERVEVEIAARRGFVWRRSGWTADAFLLKGRAGAPAEWVYKRIKPTIPSGNLMPKPNARLRTTFRDMTLWVLAGLAQSPHFEAYKDLLPETQAHGRFAMLQALGKGLAYKDLSDGAQGRANNEVALIKAAAQKALPFVEIDVNKGNILFDASGKATSLFDPAGGWWARLLGDALRGDRRDWRVDHKSRPLFVANSVALVVKGGDLKFGDALLVANVDRGKAFIVKHGFKMVYERPHALSGNKPLFELLGPPTSEETLVGDNSYRQTFERGEMRWDPKQSTRVTLYPR